MSVRESKVWYKPGSGDKVDASRGIFFYDKDKPYYNFTNFASSKIIIDGKTWPNVEQYYQAMKFTDPNIQEAIRHLPNPRAAFSYTKQPHIQAQIRPDWRQINDKVMKKALQAKFKQNKHLAKELLATGNKILVEDSHLDAFWGNGNDNRGANKLGQLLMEVRQELRLDLKRKASPVDTRLQKNAAKPKQSTVNIKPLRAGSSSKGLCHPKVIQAVEKLSASKGWSTEYVTVGEHT